MLIAWEFAKIHNNAISSYDLKNKNNSMNKKTIAILSILIIFILGAIFYWFQWRPTQIRKNCYNSAIKNPFKNPNATELERRSKLDFIYQNCLKMNGLKK